MKIYHYIFLTCLTFLFLLVLFSFLWTTLLVNDYKAYIERLEKDCWYKKDMKWEMLKSTNGPSLIPLRSNSENILIPINVKKQMIKQEADKLFNQWKRPTRYKNTKSFTQNI